MNIGKWIPLCSALLGGCTAPTVGGQAMQSSSAGPVAVGNASNIFGAASKVIRSDGTSIGTVSAAQLDWGVAFGIVASGLPPGDYRLYLHSIGRCQPATFASAGPAWTSPVPIGYGLPDLGIHKVGPDGKLSFTRVAQGLKLRSGQPGDLVPLLDSDGVSLVLHSPSGTAYAPPVRTTRVACAVVM